MLPVMVLMNFLASAWPVACLVQVVK